MYPQILIWTLDDLRCSVWDCFFVFLTKEQPQQQPHPFDVCLGCHGATRTVVRLVETGVTRTIKLKGALTGGTATAFCVLKSYLMLSLKRFFGCYINVFYIF